MWGESTPLLQKAALRSTIDGWARAADSTLESARSAAERGEQGSRALSGFARRGEGRVPS